MAFQTPLTIKEVIDNIHQKNYLLPSIQREFVWSKEQIKKLFDSLMRDYPINSFLFWKIPEEKSSEFIFYEFLREYHQKDNKHNLKANTKLNSNITAILDGQQRLTSLYIGLMGNYANKISYKRFNDPLAYPKKRLYVNLLSEPKDNNYMYNFEFLSDEEVINNEEDYWFLVGEILKFKEQYEINAYLISNNLFGKGDKSLYANQTIYKLFAVINSEPVISYYLEKSEELEKVLNIFIRINSGGTTLSYSDLLLSFASTQWEGRDAREEIISFVDEMNAIGNGFNFDKDIILKSCLVLCDFTDITFKVDNFNKANMIKIEQEWSNITKAIRDAANLLSSFGFNRENMSSNTILIVIAYYLKKIGLPNNYNISGSYINDRSKIKKWIISSLMKRVFSFSPDGVLIPIRKILNENGNTGFPLEQIIDKFKGTNRDIKFDDDDIEELLYLKYGKKDTFLILSILYPWADLRNYFNIDHIHPKSEFTIKKLNKRGIREEELDAYIGNADYLGNLQLLDNVTNMEKKAKDFEMWLHDTIAESEISTYMSKHYIPNVDLSLKNFPIFLEEREKLLFKELKKKLS